jgi:hypothetical protein
MNFKTLHIFGYGECQSISETDNKKLSIEECPTAQSVVDMIYSHKPVDNTSTTSYHSVNIFKDMFADYSSMEGSFRVEYSLLDVSLINQLNEEINK